MIPLWILGGGGHARVVIDAARSSGRFEVAGILDDQAMPGRDAVDGVAIMGPITSEAVKTHQIAHAVIAIGNNRVRGDIADRLHGLVTWEPVVHARAYVAPHTEIGAGCVICAMAVVQPGTILGRHVILNTAVTVDHDNVTGELVHIGPGANLASDVIVEKGTLLGIGSRVIPGCRVGSWTTVGAGGVVVRDLPDNVIAVGVPAKVSKEREPGWHQS